MGRIKSIKVLGGHLHMTASKWWCLVDLSTRRCASTKTRGRVWWKGSKNDFTRISQRWVLSKVPLSSSLGKVEAALWTCVSANWKAWCMTGHLDFMMYTTPERVIRIGAGLHCLRQLSQTPYFKETPLSAVIYALLWSCRSLLVQNSLGTFIFIQAFRHLNWICVLGRWFLWQRTTVDCRLI